MQNSSEINKDHRLWLLLYQVRDIMLSAREKELRKQVGITPEQSQILTVVNAIGNEATPAEISRWTFHRPHTISGILNRMEKAGLVKKSKDLPKKNMVRITITERGQQAYKKSLEAGSISRIMSALSEEKHQQLRSCLEALREKGITEIGFDIDELPFLNFF